VHMGSTKKQKIIVIVELLLIFLFLFTIGSGNVISPLYGDIDVIDEGLYGAWMMHLFAGGHLFKDTYSAYGPLYIYPVYFLANFFSPTVFLIRIVYSVFNVFFAIIIVKLLLKEMKIPYALQIFCIVLILIVPGLVM